jgi:hypothetical protein
MIYYLVFFFWFSTKIKYFEESIGVCPFVASTPFFTFAHYFLNHTLWSPLLPFET